MQVFTYDLGSWQNLSDRYRKKNEISELSIPIEFQNNRFRAIIFRESKFGIAKKDISGIVLFSEDGEVVTNHRIAKELISLSYYAESTLSDRSLGIFRKSISSEKVINDEMMDYKDIGYLLDDLKDSGAQNLDKFMEILMMLPDTKVQSNEAIKQYLDKAKSYEGENFVFSRDILNEMTSLYKNILLKNLERVRTINKGKDYYDNINVAAKKLRKILRWKVSGRGLMEFLNRLDHTLEHFKKTLSVYEQVLKLNDVQYINHMKSLEHKDIEDRLKLIR